MRELLGWLLGLGLWLWALPAWGAQLPALTPELLAQRVEQLEAAGPATVNLRELTIDLTQPALREAFYRQLQQPLQRGSRPVALDLSGAVVQGELDLRRLGLREPLYGDALMPLLEPDAQEQLRRDRKRLTQLSLLSRSLLIQAEGAAQPIYLMRGPLLWERTRFSGPVLGGDTFFLGALRGAGAVFEQGLYLGGARFVGPVQLGGSRFEGIAQLRGAIFFGGARFDQSQFQQAVFQGAEFQQNAVFNGSTFAAEANFSRVQWQGNADFARTLWQGEGSFFKDAFSQALFFTEARFEASTVLRQARFSQPVNLRNAVVMAPVDLGDTTFFDRAYINVSGLEFNAEQGVILGSPGQIGRVFSVPVLTGNETLLRNLARNFRQQEQIADANAIEYTAERLRLRQWGRQLRGVNVNTAAVARLVRLGFSEEQGVAIATQRQQQPFLSGEDLLALDAIDLATYVKLKDRILTQRPLSAGGRLQRLLGWLWLGTLLVLSHYGTSFGLLLGHGLIALALFAQLFWVVDRCRRRRPTPILPPPWEVAVMATTGLGLLVIGLSTVLRLADYPGWSLLGLGLLVVPAPALLTAQLLRQGRYHDLMDESYFVEDGSLRQLRLLIARLPVIPKFPFFRDRYTPLPWPRRWNWLNYYDFSAINWLKFGFNDIRLRDQQVPSWVTALVWYQWGLGLFYVGLLLWTLSRTIPGLNLLLYF